MGFAEVGRIIHRHVLSYGADASRMLGIRIVVSRIEDEADLVRTGCCRIEHGHGTGAIHKEFADTIGRTSNASQLS